MKKTVMITICLWLIFPFFTSAQEIQRNQSENTIHCAEFEVTIANFESVDPSVIRVCCGGLFSNDEKPCQLLTKAKYESFSGQSEVDFNSIQEGFLLTDLVELKKHKLSKVKQIEITDSSVTQLGNNMKIAIKKGNYSIDQDGKIWLQVEYLK